MTSYLSTYNNLQGLDRILAGPIRKGKQGVSVIGLDACPCGYGGSVCMTARTRLTIIFRLSRGSLGGRDGIDGGT